MPQHEDLTQTNMQYRTNGLATSVFWDRECVIYHHESGNTHLIADVPENLLQCCLSLIPYSEDDLLKLMQQFSEPSEQDFSAYINQLLAMLINKDLIEQLN